MCTMIGCVTTSSMWYSCETMCEQNEGVNHVDAIADQHDCYCNNGMKGDIK